MKRFTKLTTAELQIMNILWDMKEGGCAWDVISKCEEPKPAYSTIATLLKILSAKEFLTTRKGMGKTLIYVPLISRENYAKLEVHAMKQNLFGGSMRRMLRFFVEEEELSADEIQDLLALKAEE